MPFPTIAVLDGAGVSRTINTQPDAGQEASADSLPVVLSTEQQTILSAIVTALSSVAVTGTFWQATQPVSGPLTDAQLRASNVVVTPGVTKNAAPTILALTTDATGTNYTAFSSQACTTLSISNPSTTDIEYRRGGAGAAMPIAAGASYLVLGITNANQIDVRRKDTSNTQITIGAEAFA
jgi:hypothetical protein